MPGPTALPDTGLEVCWALASRSQGQGSPGLPHCSPHPGRDAPPHPPCRSGHLPERPQLPAHPHSRFLGPGERGDASLCPSGLRLQGGQHGQRPLARPLLWEADKLISVLVGSPEGPATSLRWHCPRRWPAALSLAPCRPASTGWEPARLLAPASPAPLSPGLGVPSPPCPPQPDSWVPDATPHPTPAAASFKGGERRQCPCLHPEKHSCDLNPGLAGHELLFSGAAAGLTPWAGGQLREGCPACRQQRPAGLLPGAGGVWRLLACAVLAGAACGQWLGQAGLRPHMQRGPGRGTVGGSRAGGRGESVRGQRQGSPARPC